MVRGPSPPRPDSVQGLSGRTRVLSRYTHPPSDDGTRPRGGPDPSGVWKSNTPTRGREGDPHPSNRRSLPSQSSPRARGPTSVGGCVPLRLLRFLATTQSSSEAFTKGGLPDPGPPLDPRRGLVPRTLVESLRRHCSLLDWSLVSLASVFVGRAGGPVTRLWDPGPDPPHSHPHTGSPSRGGGRYSGVPHRGVER